MNAPSAEERARLRALADAATQGPWVVHQEHYRDYTDEGVSHVEVATTKPEAIAWTCTRGWDGPDEAVENAEFIAAVRTAVPTLLDALDAAEATRDELGAAYREAIGVPEEQHTRERMERMAAAVEALTAERDALAERVDTLRDELGHAIRTRDEWESNAGDAEARVDAAEAKLERVLADAVPLIRRAIFDPGQIVMRGPDHDGNAYGERLDQWQNRAIESVLADLRGDGAS